MDPASRYVMERYIRTSLKEFTPKEMQSFLSTSGVKATIREIEEFLRASKYVYPLQNNRFITRSGIYTDEVFSIKPTRAEVEQGVFVVGSRCCPFVDPDMVSCSMEFYVEGNLLRKKVGQFDSDLAIDMFIMFGEEYCTQYIASDPAVEELHLEERNFELPAKVPLTGIDLTYLKHRYGFEYGDRLLCCVKDWDEGVLSLMVLKEAGNDFNLGPLGRMKLEWYDTLEQCFLKSFDEYGPGSSIEDQVNYVFSRNIHQLCLTTAGSLEEYIQDHMKKVSMEYFGVETRLWHKGKPVPAVGTWNSNRINTIAVRNLDDFVEKKYHVPEDILDQYVLDHLYRREEDMDKVVERIYPKEYNLSSDERKAVLLHINERNAIFSKHYNWFCDQDLGPVRKQILLLFTRVSYLVFRVDCIASGLNDFPQQELVVLSQLYGHLLHMLNGVASGEFMETETSVLLDSVEGMSWNFEDIRGPIEKVLRKQEKNRFVVSKG